MLFMLFILFYQGGKTVAATRTNFAAIVGHGVAMTVGFIGPCGINLPHTHPRATEINFIVSGQFMAGFFQENGVLPCTLFPISKLLIFLFLVVVGSFHWKYSATWNGDRVPAGSHSLRAEPRLRACYVRGCFQQ